MKFLRRIKNWVYEQKFCKVALFNAARKQGLSIISTSQQSSWNVAAAKVTMWPHVSPPQHPRSGVSVQDGSRKTPLYTTGDFNIKMDIFLSLTIWLLLPLPDDRFKRLRMHMPFCLSVCFLPWIKSPWSSISVSYVRLDTNHTLNPAKFGGRGVNRSHFYRSQ